MTTPFGRATTRQRRSTIDVAALVEVAADLLPILSTDTLDARLIDPHSSDPVITLEEGERRLRIDASELARAMERARIDNSDAALAQAITHWVLNRAATDLAAETSGLAILDWTDATRTTVCWRVAISRGDAIIAWTPSTLLDTARVDAVRAVAMTRSQSQPTTVIVDGSVAVWTSPTLALSTAVLTDPARMLTDMSSHGLTIRDTMFIVAPGRPVAAADSPAATRLCAGAADTGVTVPPHRLHTLGWR